MKKKKESWVPEERKNSGGAALQATRDLSSHQIFKFKTLSEASSLEGYFSFEYQTWNDGMTDVHRPPTLTLPSRTGAAKPTLWPTLNPCHFTVPCFIFKTKTFSFSSKQALSNNVFSVKIGRTTTLRQSFKVINFRRSKFVCTLSPCSVFGMCASGLATHLTTPVCPVARTQTIILQVVYYRCWFYERKALWRWFYPRSRKRNHFFFFRLRLRYIYFNRITEK